MKLQKSWWKFLTIQPKMVIKIHAQKFINDLNFFQQENLSLFPFIEGRLEQLDAYINNETLMTMENFGESLVTIIQNLNFAPDSFCPINKYQGNSFK